MQIAPIPVSNLPTAMPQDAVAKTITQVQAQAATPLLQRAIDPSTSSERKQKSKSNQEKATGGKENKDGEEKRGGKVNIRV